MKKIFKINKIILYEQKGNVSESRVFNMSSLYELKKRDYKIINLCAKHEGEIDHDKF